MEVGGWGEGGLNLLKLEMIQLIIYYLGGTLSLGLMVTCLLIPKPMRTHSIPTAWKTRVHVVKGNALDRDDPITLISLYPFF